MIHPDTYTKKTHKGIALFAKKNLRKGEIIWVLDKKTDKILPAHHYRSLTKAQKEKVNWAGYLDSQGRFVMPGDNGLYVNHSCSPNCTYLLEFDNISVAKRDIAVGEEITEDYRCYHGHVESFECKCGAANCSGFLDGDAPFQSALRLSIGQVGSLILRHHQPLLNIDFEQKMDFIQTLKQQSHGHYQPQNLFARLGRYLSLELAVPIAAH